MSQVLHYSPDSSLVGRACFGPIWSWPCQVCPGVGMCRINWTFLSTPCNMRHHLIIVSDIDWYCISFKFNLILFWSYRFIYSDRTVRQDWRHRRPHLLRHPVRRRRRCSGRGFLGKRWKRSYKSWQRTYCTCCSFLCAFVIFYVFFFI